MNRPAPAWLKLYTLALFCLGMSSCTPSIPEPQLSSVMPNWGYNGTQTPVVLSGESLFPGIEATDGSSIKLDLSHRIWLQTSPPTELSAVALIDTRKISALVPPGIEPGDYDLELEMPSGTRARLAQAFQVTDSLADHIQASAEKTSWTVPESAVVSLSVRDLAESKVALPLEVRVWASGSGVGEGFAFREDTLQDQTPDAVSGGIRGRLRADGEGYIALSTPSPGEVNLRIEAVDPDSVVQPALQTVRFQAGQVVGLALSLPSDDFDTTAGASFEVQVELVDALGNPVTGVPASVLLTESCAGGTMSTFIPLLDHATAVVAATAATDADCTDNQILAIGIAEGGTVAGSSERFDVLPNILDHLSVAAAPTLITAGSDELTVSVQAVDAWSNRVLSAEGTLWLEDEAGILQPEFGNGSHSCSPLSEGTAICTATFFRGGSGRQLTAATDAGAHGVSNPVTVLPGPGDHIEAKIDHTEVEAGAGFPVQITLLDIFDNPIELTETELDGTSFFDHSGTLSCVQDPEVEVPPSYGFVCRCTTAQLANTISVVLDSVASSGETTAFDVVPSALSQVDLNLMLDGPHEHIEAGESITASLLGRDEYGNPTEDSLTVELSDTAGGLSPTSAELTDGHATLSLVFSTALVGNTVSASAGDSLLGISTPFEVRPGAAIGLDISSEQPWAWTGERTLLRIQPQDAYGNLVMEAEDDVLLSSTAGLGADVWVTVAGDTSTEFEFDVAGLGDTLLAEGSALSGLSEPIDIVTDCIDGPTVGVTVIGTTYDSLCLGADERALATVTAEAVDLHTTHLLIGTAHHRGDESSIEHSFEGAGRTDISALGIRLNGCAEQTNHTVFHGPVGEPVGVVEVSVADGSLLAGTTGGDERTRVSFSARECTGDLADGAELSLRATLGALESTGGTALSSTGRGLQIELDSLGEGTVRWTMADLAIGGMPELYAGGLSGASLGSAWANVSGDDVPPQVLQTLPGGTGGGAFTEVEIIFTEPMLTSLSEATLMDAVELSDPDGAVLSWSAAAWSTDGMVLSMFLGTPQDSSSGAWSLHIYDELRDESGNRLDGDLDGSSGGSLLLQFGDILDAAPTVIECEPSTATLRPDGDDGAGWEADTVAIELATDTAAEWWRVEVFDAMGAMVLHRRDAPVGTETNTITWSGRDQDGEVLSNGLYLLELTPTDSHWNPGQGCSLTVRLDNHLSPIQVP